MSSGSVVVLSGGAGGAKLVEGLYRILAPGMLTVIVNTGDDFRHLGLWISPDVDTTLYTLAGLADPERGWGRCDESWNFMKALAELGGETWFKLGDRDLALHVERTRRGQAGESLSAITAALAQALGVRARVLPMSDDTVATLIETDAGELGFQSYFVRARCEPKIRAIRFWGAERARPSREILQALGEPGLAAIVIAPSNPYLSIDPILAVAGLREAVRRAGVPVVAVTPILGGAAVKGPTAKIMAELGLEVSPVTVASHYDGLIDGFVLDARDRALAPRFRIPVTIADTLMNAPEARERVARAALELARALKSREASQ
jgi:LPPG:FO 2-phospho-L-lactate transferase